MLSLLRYEGTPLNGHWSLSPDLKDNSLRLRRPLQPVHEFARNPKVRAGAGEAAPSDDLSRHVVSYGHKVKQPSDASKVYPTHPPLPFLRGYHVPHDNGPFGHLLGVALAVGPVDEAEQLCSSVEVKGENVEGSHTRGDCPAGDDVHRRQLHRVDETGHVCREGPALGVFAGVGAIELQQVLLQANSWHLALRTRTQESVKPPDGSEWDRFVDMTKPFMATTPVKYFA